MTKKQELIIDNVLCGMEFYMGKISQPKVSVQAFSSSIAFSHKRGAERGMITYYVKGSIHMSTYNVKIKEPEVIYHPLCETFPFLRRFSFALKDIKYFYEKYRRLHAIFEREGQTFSVVLYENKEGAEVSELMDEVENRIAQYSQGLNDARENSQISFLTQSLNTCQDGL
jgi:hypothetical protein